MSTTIPMKKIVHFFPIVASFFAAGCHRVEKSNFEYHATAIQNLPLTSYVASISNSVPKEQGDSAGAKNCDLVNTNGRIEIENFPEPSLGACENLLDSLHSRILAASTWHNLIPFNVTIHIESQARVHKHRKLLNKYDNLWVDLHFGMHGGDTEFLSQKIIDTVLHEGFHVSARKRAYPELLEERLAYSISRCSEYQVTGNVEYRSFDFIGNKRWLDFTSRPHTWEEVTNTYKDDTPSFFAGILTEMEVQHVTRPIQSGMREYCDKLFSTPLDYTDKFVTYPTK